MIYSTDDRKTWIRLRCLGWDRFSTFVSKANLAFPELTSYLPQDSGFEADPVEWILFPWKFKHNSDASKKINRVITEFLQAEAKEFEDVSTENTREKFSLFDLLSDDELAAARWAVIDFSLELSEFAELLKKGDVWVAWPSQRGSLRVSNPPEVNEAGKRLCEGWKQLTRSQRWAIADGSTIVTASLERPTEPKNADELSLLQGEVLWRSTHLVAIQAFADFVILSIHRAQGFPQMPGIGCAVATRAVLELTAHYIRGTQDPFDSGENFHYGENLQQLDLHAEYKEVCKYFKVRDLNRPQPSDEEIHKYCSKVLHKVWNTLNKFLKPLNKTQESELAEAGVSFTEPTNLGIPNEWRTSIARENLNTQIEVVSFGYEWLLALWAVKDELTSHNRRLPITAYQVNTRAYCWSLKSFLIKIENYKEDNPHFKDRLNAIADLLKAFCLASNLAPLVAGAIARELHLHVEEFTEQVLTKGLSKEEAADKKRNPEIDKRLRQLKEEGNSNSEEYEALKKKEDDKSLKCIEDDLTKLNLPTAGKKNTVPNLNSLRVQLQDVLQSFAHPGWLIRTETAFFSQPQPGVSRVMISDFYRSPFAFAAIDPHTLEIRSYPYIEQRELNSFYQVLKKRVPKTITEAMRIASGPQSDTTRPSGSAFEVPFAAVLMCQMALEHVINVKGSA